MVMVLMPPAALESKIAWRREPAPLSLPLVTSKLAAHAVQGDRQVPSNRPAVSARRRFGRQSFIADLRQRFANRETSAGECASCAAQRRARTERACQRPARPSRGRGEMDNLTPPSRVARGPGLPALQAHDRPPSATGLPGRTLHAHGSRILPPPTVRVGPRRVNQRASRRRRLPTPVSFEPYPHYENPPRSLQSDWRLSAFGTKRTYRDVRYRSAFEGKADSSQRLSINRDL